MRTKLHVPPEETDTTNYCFVSRDTEKQTSTENGSGKFVTTHKKRYEILTLKL